MPMNSDRVAVLVKLEATSGTDSAPVAGTDAVWCRSVKRTKPLEHKQVDREVVRTFYGALAKISGGAFGEIEIEIEAAGFGVAGPAAPTPGYDALLQIGGHSRTVTANTNVIYAPISSAIKTASIYYYMDGTLWKMTYTYADLEFKGQSGDVPVIVATCRGLVQPVTDVALPSPALSAWIEPLMLNSANTTFSLHGTAVGVNSYSYKINNELDMREPVGVPRYMWFNNRNPSGSVEIENTTVAVKNWHSICDAGTKGVLTMTHGTTGGNRWTLAMPITQLLNYTDTEVDRVAHLNISYIALPGNNGNDEHSYTVL